MKLQMIKLQNWNNCLGTDYEATKRISNALIGLPALTLMVWATLKDEWEKRESIE